MVKDFAAALLREPGSEYCTVNPEKFGPLLPCDFTLTCCADVVDVELVAVPATEEVPLDVLAVILNMSGVRSVITSGEMHPLGTLGTF